MAWLFALQEHVSSGFVIFLLLVACVSKVLYNLYLHPLRDYPGPWLARASRLYYAYFIEKGMLSIQTRKLHGQYGNCFRIAPDELSYTNPDAWQDIYGLPKGKTGDFEKDRTFYPVTPKKIDNIITAKSDVHRRFRRLLSSPLSEKALAAQEDIIIIYVDLFIEKLRDQTGNTRAGGTVNMVLWFTFVSFDILGDLAFGESFGCLESGKLHSWITMIHTAVKSALSLQTLQRFIPGLFNLVMRVMMIVGNTMVENPIDNFEFCARKAGERLNKDLDRPDFMTYILRSNDENGMTREEIEANSQVLIDAGTETVATALSGIFFYLISSPDNHRRLVSEIRSAFSTSDKITIVSTQSLHFLKAVLEEGMRMYPPAPGTFPRTTPPGGAIICGKFVPGGYSVGINQVAITRSDENFVAPNEFLPERWMRDGRFAADRKMAFQPFSFGPRNCIGKNLAYAEMRLVITKLLWHFDVELQADSRAWDVGQKINMYWEKGVMNVKLVQVVK